MVLKGHLKYLIHNFKNLLSSLTSDYPQCNLLQNNWYTLPVNTKIGVEGPSHWTGNECQLTGYILLKNMCTKWLNKRTQQRRFKLHSPQNKLKAYTRQQNTWREWIRVLRDWAKDGYSNIQIMPNTQNAVNFLPNEMQ